MLSPHVPDLAGLQLLLAVERTGSIGAAGAEAGISQQAASARVQAVEAQVGVPLLVRTPQGSRLTAAGALVARWALPVVDAARELDAGIGSLRSDRAAHLRVAASLTVAEHLAPRWFVALRARLGTEVSLVATNSDAVAAAVTAGEADVGFVEGPDAPAGLRARTVGHDQLLVVVDPDHPWATRTEPLTATELAATPLVAREAGSGTRRALARALADHLPTGTVLAPPAMELASAAAVRAAVAAGVAPGALSTLAVADDLALGRLVPVAVAGVDLHRVLRAVWRTGAEPPAGPARDLVAIARAGRT
ncbi:LysR family transcriptional regulator [Rhodococcus aerolatus]